MWQWLRLRQRPWQNPPDSARRLTLRVRQEATKSKLGRVLAQHLANLAGRRAARNWNLLSRWLRLHPKHCFRTTTSGIRFDTTPAPPATDCQNLNNQSIAWGRGAAGAIAPHPVPHPLPDDLAPTNMRPNYSISLYYYNLLGPRPPSRTATHRSRPSISALSRRHSYPGRLPRPAPTPPDSHSALAFPPCPGSGTPTYDLTTSTHRQNRKPTMP